jgi:hypothetical protein
LAKNPKIPRKIAEIFNAKKSLYAFFRVIYPSTKVIIVYQQLLFDLNYNIIHSYLHIYKNKRLPVQKQLTSWPYPSNNIQTSTTKSRNKS